MKMMMVGDGKGDVGDDHGDDDNDVDGGDGVT